MVTAAPGLQVWTDWIYLSPKHPARMHSRNGFEHIPSAGRFSHLCTTTVLRSFRAYSKHAVVWIFRQMGNETFDRQKETGGNDVGTAMKHSATSEVAVAARKAADHGQQTDESRHLDWDNLIAAIQNSQALLLKPAKSPAFGPTLGILPKNTNSQVEKPQGWVSRKFWSQWKSMWISNRLMCHINCI